MRVVQYSCSVQGIRWSKNDLSFESHLTLIIIEAGVPECDHMSEGYTEEESKAEGHKPVLDATCDPLTIRAKMELSYAWMFPLICDFISNLTPYSRGGQPAQHGTIHLPAPNLSHFDPFENGAFVASVSADLPYWDCRDDKVQAMLLSPAYETRWSPAFKPSLAVFVDERCVLNQLAGPSQSSEWLRQGSY
ncbi:hypothetical protein Y032_0003g1210 [Ancylostoma ceylanicum]|uniref:Uncharacterized protein n=1 Tax=Ancylostoma ceylanicum TaxID=53326 RepID=A0A016VVV9_9BILA|nr:hypothetical protein Y032_0003g1210 [Ancylostoma ceylanicum]